jgi:hypothetical protein
VALEPQHIRELVAEIAAPTARQRELAAEKVADWLSASVEPKLAAVLARALEGMLSLEESESAMEAQLNAIAEMSSLGLVPGDVIARVISSRQWDQPWAVDFIDGLRDDLPIAPQ